MSTPERTALYRFYNTSGHLLYIGISRDPDGRLKAHRWGRNRAPWVEQISSRTLEWHDSRAEALTAEATAIRRERPRHNGTHNYDDARLDAGRWKPVDGSKLVAVAELMRDEIDSGRWMPGQRIPSLATLARSAGVSMRLASKAAVQLQGEGLLLLRSGEGIFVASRH